MKILITGNLGYVGSVLVKILKKKNPNYIIYGLDLSFFSGCLLDDLVHNDHFVDFQIHKDVRDINENDLNGIDVVIHLAAVSNDPMGKNFENATYEINTKSTIDIANLSKKCGVKKFIFASSCSVYGEGGNIAKSENSEINPLTAYAKSKIDSEEKLKDIVSENFEIICLRFATACGYSPRFRMDLVLNDFVTSAFIENKIKILSDGSPLRPLIHVNDMSNALYWAINYKTDGNLLIVNAGANDWNFQVKDLAFIVKSIFQNCEIEINTSAPPDKRSYKVDFSMYAMLSNNHKSSISIEEAILEIKNKLEESNFSNKNFRNSSFIRLNVLNKLVEKGKLNKNLNYNL